jgi:acyl-CoA synthetase (AMP-forming)/AMP-acid ligase II/alpha-beta hydrolase superfamily lysophospholipase
VILAPALAENPNLAARLALGALRHPERDAIVAYRGRGVTRLRFGDLTARIAAVAAGLAARGIGPGDRVLLFVPMSPELYVALLAVLHRGACAVFVDAWAGRARLDAAVRQARPRAFLAVPKAHWLKALSPALRAVPVSLVARPGLAGLGDVAAVPAEVVTEDDHALVTFTTGSTGAPKAAARSHGFLWAQHQALNAHLGLTPGDVDLPTLPVFVLNNLAVGATSVLCDFDPRRPAEIDPARVRAQIVEAGVTTTSGSPAFYERLGGWCARRGLTLPVRALFTGGAPVFPRLVRLLRETTQGVVHVVYGSTEAEPIAGIEAGAMLDAMRGAGAEGLCVGAPVHEIELRLVRPTDGPVALDGRGWAAWDVAPGAVGEVVVAGRHVLAGYLDAPEADRANKVRDGARVWHRTGDAARLDPSGRLWLMGRISRRVLRSGVEWWSLPAEIRALGVESVRHAAYLGTPDATLGQRAVLCVECAGGRLSTAARAGLREALAAIPVDEVRAMSRIPRDPRHQSKTDATALARLLASRGARRRRNALVVLAAATLVVLATLAFLPPDTRGIVSRPHPARDYEEALARVADLEARDPPGVREDCRTILMGPGARTDRAVVLFHGLTNCPRQFERLGALLRDRGCNVLISRLPRHGLADRMTPELANLRAEEIAAHADLVVDAAAGLGRSVTVVGLSLGGNAAAWVAEERAEVDRAIIIAPGLGLPMFPRWMSDFAVHYFADTPNRFHWWNSAQRERIAGPPQVYPRFATRALGEMLELGAAVRARARERAPAAREVVLVRVGGDKAVHNGLIRDLGREWRAHGGHVLEFEFPAALGLNHDLIDPDQVGARTELVYPMLLEWIDGDAPSAVPGAK